MSDFTKQPLIKKKNRQNILDRVAKVERKVLAAPSATVAALSEISRDLGSAGQGVNQLMVRGDNVTTRTLNYYLVYSTSETQMTPDVLIPNGGVTQSNIIRVVIVGKIYNNSGGAVNLTPKIYIGLNGSETQSGAATALSVPSATSDRGFIFSFTVQGSPNGGTNVIVDEKLELDSTGDVVGLVRSTTTQIGTVATLQGIDNIYVTFTLGTAHAAIKLWTNNITVELLEGVQDEQTEYRFFSTTFDDTLIQDNNPTTNYGTNTQLNIGESNAAASVNRTLIRCTNLTSIPSNALVTKVVLYLYITADASSNVAQLDIYPAANNWTEAGATWNTYDGTNAWTGTGTHYNNGTNFTNTGLTAAEPVGKIVAWDFTDASSKSYMQTAIAGGNNYGWVLKTNAETNDMYQYGSSENATAYAVPVLEVRYTLPS